ncbi:hypothetical protein FIU82_17285 (plasmid) [Pseudoalteromonas sp. THAF3]|uniref:hypothetical protein n=1 Tax=Pseudoalteromonas TaxID=53246 RepID=UPI001248B6AA|nr:MULTISPECIES: hypothetical protein [Pseudoalteromonas]MCF2860687.1 hypothetical protein [Pseudoalteromonas sp. CNAT2-18]MCG7556556.1 hypothetical protein [Pseudoalteromonas sp. CNAT2-18.1]MCG7565602.1 hypothetical protein [Pseudoalteromonas sp. CnMc7-15]MCG7569221.1 hypothetical protein [Pseudoalteromonas sp. CNC9-20]QFU06748.1 hypothetical protein FIU82_17285 [Pseudoalteromonas sp. THAF3]|tara:strand:- start:800 stop:1096 length:297 start_codon:yes stop_codon:yes gene_type:complete
MTIRTVNSLTTNPALELKRNQQPVGDGRAQEKPALEQPASSVKDSSQGRRLADALYRQTIYDQPANTRTSNAIATYKEYAFLERRQEVQSMLSVSVYA